MSLAHDGYDILINGGFFGFILLSRLISSLMPEDIFLKLSFVFIDFLMKKKIQFLILKLKVVKLEIRSIVKSIKLFVYSMKS